MDLLYKLVFRHRFGRVINMPALVLEGSDSLRTDIFDEEKLKIFVIHRMKDFWLTDMHGCATDAPPLKPIVERGGCGGDRNGYRGGRRGGWPDDALWLRHFVQDGRRLGPSVRPIVIVILHRSYT